MARSLMPLPCEHPRRRAVMSYGDEPIAEQCISCLQVLPLVCPRCGEHTSDLARHQKTRHPAPRAFSAGAVLPSRKKSSR
ncbi:MAG: hypothetical protein JO086_00160 [Acidimicrobiia bacterium]|nr:hypothetical protein [Acidimicrobiia bacterium]